MENNKKIPAKSQKLIRRENDTLKSQRKLEVKTKLAKARENEGDQVVIGVSFASDWSRGWREFSEPITKLGKAKSEQSRITFDI